MEVVVPGPNPTKSNESRFQSQVDAETARYHVPWMSYDPPAGPEHQQLPCLA